VAATLSDWTDPDPGIVTISSHTLRVAGLSPSSSLPNTKANGPLAQNREQLPELEIGAARRRRTVFDKLHVAVGEGARAMRRSEDRVRIGQRSGAKRRLWRFRAEGNRLCRNDAKLLSRISKPPIAPAWPALFARTRRPWVSVTASPTLPEARQENHRARDTQCAHPTERSPTNAIPAPRCVTKWIRRHGAHILGSHQCHRQTRPDGTPWPTLRCWH
jgi:hypothetical protein